MNSCIPILAQHRGTEVHQTIVLIKIHHFIHFITSFSSVISIAFSVSAAVKYCSGWISDFISNVT